VFFAAHVVAMSSTVYNPFLYAWMNDNFRKEFRRVLPCLAAAQSAVSWRCGAPDSTACDTTMRPAAAAVVGGGKPNARYPSPSRYSSATGKTEPPAGASGGDRRGARGPRTRLDVDEQQVRFVDATDDEYDDDNCDDRYDYNYDENYDCWYDYNCDYN